MCELKLQRVYVVSLVDASEATVIERTATKLSDEELKKRRIPHVEYQYPASGNAHQDAMIAMLCMPDFIQVDILARQKNINEVRLIVNRTQVQRIWTRCSEVSRCATQSHRFH